MEGFPCSRKGGVAGSAGSGIGGKPRRGVACGGVQEHVHLIGQQRCGVVVGDGRWGGVGGDVAGGQPPGDRLLMHLRMPHLDGVEATRRIRRAQPSVQVIVVTTYADGASVFSALRAGARGYLTKDANAEVLGLIAAGLANLEIAERLMVSEATVKTHINRIFAKAGSATGPRRSPTPTATTWPAPDRQPGRRRQRRIASQARWSS